MKAYIRPLVSESSPNSLPNVWLRRGFSRRLKPIVGGSVCSCSHRRRGRNRYRGRFRLARSSPPLSSDGFDTDTDSDPDPEMASLPQSGIISVIISPCRRTGVTSRPLSRPRLPPERDSSRQPRNGIVRFPASRQVAMISSEVERRPARALHNPRGRRLPRARLHLSTRGQSRAHFLRHPLPQTLGTQHTKVRARMPGGPHGDLSEAGLTVSMPVPPRDSTPKRPLSSLRSIDIRGLAFPLEPLDDPGPVAAFFHLLKSRLIGGLLKRSG